MPAQSQQQQKLFGLALAFKRGEVPASEVSDEIKDIADRMSEKEIEDFAATKHKGLPKMKEQLRKIVREIMRERAISEIELSKDDMDKLHSDGEVEVDGEKVTYEEFNNLSEKEIKGKHAGNYVKRAPAGRTIEINGVIYTSLGKGKWKGPDGKKLNWIEISAMASALGNKKVVYESVNEGYSTEEKRIVMMAVRKLAKYRNVPLDYAINDLLGAGKELERDIKRGKITK